LIETLPWKSKNRLDPQSRKERQTIFLSLRFLSRKKYIDHFWLTALNMAILSASARTLRVSSKIGQRNSLRRAGD
jgi:hypothetical protein